MPTVLALHTAKATRLPMRSVERVDVEVTPLTVDVVIQAAELWPADSTSLTKFGVGIDGLGHRWHQRHGVAAERSVHERLLAVAGRLEHVVAHAAEGDAQVEAGLGDVLEQRNRER